MRATWAWLWPGALPKQRDSAGLRLDRDRRTVLRSGRRIELSARELALLEELMQREGEPCSPNDLFVVVWGCAKVTDGAAIVDAYVQRLRAKLGDDVIETVSGSGYRLHPSAFERLK